MLSKQEEGGVMEGGVMEGGVMEGGVMEGGVMEKTLFCNDGKTDLRVSF